MDSYSADAIRGSSTLAYLPVNFLSADSQDTITSIDTDRTSGDRSMLGRDPSDICGDSSHNAALDTADLSSILGDDSAAGLPADRSHYACVDDIGIASDADGAQLLPSSEDDDGVRIPSFVCSASAVS